MSFQWLYRENKIKKVNFELLSVTDVLNPLKAMTTKTARRHAPSHSEHHIITSYKCFRCGVPSFGPTFVLRPLDEGIHFVAGQRVTFGNVGHGRHPQHGVLGLGAAEQRRSWSSAVRHLLVHCVGLQGNYIPRRKGAGTPSNPLLTIYELGLRTTGTSVRDSNRIKISLSQISSVIPDLYGSVIVPVAKIPLKKGAGYRYQTALKDHFNEWRASVKGSSAISLYSFTATENSVGPIDSK